MDIKLLLDLLGAIGTIRAVIDLSALLVEQCTQQNRDTRIFLERERNCGLSRCPCCVVNALTSFKWKESSPRLSAPKMSHTGMCPRVALVLSLEYERPLFVKTKNLFLKFLNPSLLRP